MSQCRPPGDRRDRGGGPVEVAIIMPAVILLVFGCVQLGAYFTARSLALTAAQAAVTAERKYDAEPGDGKQHAEQFLDQAGDWLTGVEISDPTYTDDQVSYVVTGTAITLVPGMSWNIRQSATGSLEQVTQP